MRAFAEQILSIAMSVTGMTEDELRAGYVPYDPSKPGDFRDADGVLICGECGIAKERVEIAQDGSEIKFPVVHYHDIEMDHALEDIEALRGHCFYGYEEYVSARFDACDFSDKETLEAYVGRFDEFKRTGHGLLFYGLPGRGKTFAAACVMNALMERKVRCKMTSITTLVDQPEFRHQRINELRKYDLVCIDDYGSERTTSYGNETGFEVINRLYSMGKPVIVTTNLTAEQLRRPPAEYVKPIERLKEKCSVIEFDGPNRRQVSA